MCRLSLASAMAVLSTLASTAFAADPCSLLSQKDAAALLGQPVAHVTPAGPQRDEDSSGQLTYCTYRAAASAVIVSVVEFPSGTEARKQLTKNLVQERMDAEDAKVSEEPGLGERSFYGVSTKGAMYVFLKKSKVVGIAIGGDKPRKSAASKEALRGAAQTVASKI
jgi:hypothetical protein